MFFNLFFNFKHVCTHDKISPNKDTCYCPDCGQLIKNEWYITRCACCGIKLKTMTKHEEIVPQEHYCTNCGSKEFTVEKLEKINFININYAVLVKKEIVEEDSYATTTQCWQERTIEKPKLLTKFL